MVKKGQKKGQDSFWMPPYWDNLILLSAKKMLVFPFLHLLTYKLTVSHFKISLWDKEQRSTVPVGPFNTYHSACTSMTTVVEFHGVASEIRNTFISTQMNFLKGFFDTLQDSFEWIWHIWGGSYEYRYLLNFTCHTMRVHNWLNARVWVQYKEG